ncbi:hypothetical protein [Marinifilum sp.]|uniref:hypothetical protein n=1 Tax=Marinifilum sp. TaxID=2033137 RepID=UPI003BAD1C0B
MTRKHILVIFIAVILQACASSVKFTSYWNSNHDSFSQKQALFYHSADKISIKVFNNNQFVDIILETNSPLTLRKIYNLGLSLWIDPNGKSKNVYAVNFPLPTDFPYTDKQFRSYLSGFNKVEYQEELLDRFQAYEIIDSRINESVLTSTIANDEIVKVKLKTTDQVLFSYQCRIPVQILYPIDTDKKVISIGISSVNMANEEYYSAMSSKQVIQKNLDELKAGTYQNKFELDEWWVNFILADNSGLMIK